MMWLQAAARPRHIVIITIIVITAPTSGSSVWRGSTHQPPFDSCPENSPSLARCRVLYLCACLRARTVAHYLLALLAVLALTALTAVVIAVIVVAAAAAAAVILVVAVESYSHRPSPLQRRHSLTTIIHPPSPSLPSHTPSLLC